MPVRQIPKSYRSLTGRFASVKTRRLVGFESSLERDLAALLEFDHRILDFEEQPLRVSYRGLDGRPHFYTPDFLVTYTYFDPQADPAIKCLVEVKYREDLWQHWKEFCPAFKAAISYAADRGWHFKILTEVEIRAAYLRPVRYLLQFMRKEPNAAVQAAVLKTLTGHVERYGVNPSVLELMNLAGQSVDRNEAYRAIWQLVAMGRIGMHFSKPLSFCRHVWPTRDQGAHPPLVPLPLPGWFRG